MNINIIGIYKIENKINKKVYIGSSKNVEKRWATHLSELRNNKHHSYHLQQAWNKYGQDSFEFSIIEILDNEFLLIEKEQYWIDKYASYNCKLGYNISNCANRPAMRKGFNRSEFTAIDFYKLGLTISEVGFLYIFIDLANKDNRITSLKDSGKPMFQQEICEVFNIDRKTLYKYLDALEKHLLIRTIQDGRNKIIYVNPKYFARSYSVPQDVVNIFG